MPKLDQRSKVAAQIRSVFNSADHPAAVQRIKEVVKEHQKTTPKLAQWMEENLPEGLTVFTLPAEHQRRMRTTNSLERVNQELKRRTRVAGIFPNEASLLRLISARLMEISEEWETGKIYLNMQSQIPPTNG